MRWCTICEQLVETDGMQLVRESGRHGRTSRTMFLDRRTGTAHDVLSEEQSRKYKPVSKTKPEVLVVHPAQGATEWETPAAEEFQEEVPEQEEAEYVSDDANA